MTSYQLTRDAGTILRLDDGTFIPADPRNRDYAEYLVWIEAGNVAAPYVGPEPVVDEIHMVWFRAALAEAGKLASVDAAVASLGPVKQALWEYATSIRIDDSDAVAIATALKIDLRATFDRAAAIRDERRST